METTPPTIVPIATSPPPRTVPPIRHYLGEARFLRDYLHGRLSEDRIAARYQGDGRSIIVLPGLLGHDGRTGVLRRTLTKAGYRAHGWGLGRNLAIKPDILDRFAARVDAVQQASGAPVTLIGWSLGGIIAREFAKRSPERVGEVITLGTPFSGNPRSNRAWRIYELLADHKVDSPPFDTVVAQKPPVRTTAIWSARDGVVSAECARGQAGERDQAIEINCGHFAMASAPVALRAVLGVLAGPCESQR